MKKLLILFLFIISLKAISQDSSIGSSINPFKNGKGVKDSFYEKSEVKEINRTGQFDHSEFEYLDNIEATDNIIGLRIANANAQPYFDKIIRVLIHADKLYLLLIVVLVLLSIAFNYYNLRNLKKQNK